MAARRHDAWLGGAFSISVLLYPDKILQYKLLSTLQISTMQLHNTTGTRDYEEQNRTNTP